MKQRRRHPASSPSRRRAGLSMLELVLALPLMLFVMALIINIGTVAAWKVRTQTNARYAAWRTLDLRTGNFDPSPRGWPSTASLSQSSGPDAQVVDRIWNSDPDLTTPVIRGPAIADPRTGRAIVVARRLEMSDGVHNGTGDLRQKIPLLQGLEVPARFQRVLGQGGRYRIRLDQNLVDNRWEFHNLGYGDNRSRRAKQWYRLDPEDFPSLAPLLGRVNQAQQAILTFPLARDLDPLDRDPEFIQYTGRAPDFYTPRISGCEADLGAFLSSPRFRQFLDEIRRKPGRMARAFIGLYQSEIDRLQSIDPPPPGANQLIQELQTKIEQLRRFQAMLPPQNR